MRMFRGRANSRREWKDGIVCSIGSCDLAFGYIDDMYHIVRETS